VESLFDPSVQCHNFPSLATPFIGRAPVSKRAIRKPDLWYHDGDHAVLMRSNLVCHDVHFDPIQRIMRPI